jgi:hypothetical protein
VPVLPGVMGLELLCEAARLPWPERLVASIEQVEFMAPFKFYRNEPRTVRLEVRYGAAGEDVLAECVLVGVRALHGRSEPERTRHFTAVVRLASAPVEVEVAGGPDIAAPNGNAVGAAAIYETYFHGPAYQVLARAWRDGELAVGELASALPANHAPADAALLAAPRLIELAFQTAGLAELADHARMGLPQAIDAVTFVRPSPAEAAGVRALARPGENGCDVIVVDAAGAPLLVLAGYRTATLSATVENRAFAALQAEVFAR